MKIYKDKFEIPIVILLIITFVAVFMMQILDSTSNVKYMSLVDNATAFARTVNNNISFFNNEDIVYLEEVVDEKYLSGIKSPFSSNLCDASSSFVEKRTGGMYITLKCDDYLLSSYNIYGKEYVIYKVGSWSLNKEKGNVESVLYNCVDTNNGQMLLDRYVEPQYFLYRYNKKYGTEHTNIGEVSNDLCKVSHNVFYRNEVEVDESS